jgi:hypothetical protein
MFICGPANGSVAYELPSGRPSPDDTLFLPSSLFFLSTGKIALRAWTTSFASGPVIRVGLYKQVFERSFERSGHAFSAVLEFSGGVPPGKVIIVTLFELLREIETHCCNNGHFCSIEQFQNFVATELLPNFSGIQQQIFAAGSRSAIEDRLPRAGTGKFFYPLAVAEGDSLAQCLEWMFFNPMSVVCKAVIWADRDAGKPGSDLAVVTSFDALADEALASLFVQLVGERSRYERLAHDMATSRGQAQRTIEDLQRKLEVTQERLAAAESMRELQAERGMHLVNPVVQSRPIGDARWRDQGFSSDQRSRSRPVELPVEEDWSDLSRDNSRVYRALAWACAVIAIVSFVAFAYKRWWT